MNGYFHDSFYSVKIDRKCSFPVKIASRKIGRVSKGVTCKMAFISKAASFGIRVTREIASASQRNSTYCSDPVTFILYPVTFASGSPAFASLQATFFRSVRKVRNEIAGICLLCGRRTDHCSHLEIQLFILWDDKERYRV